MQDFQEKGSENSQTISTVGSNEILEEILDLSRLNQKLLRNPENDVTKVVLEIKDKLNYVLNRLDKDRLLKGRKRRKFHPALFDELMQMSSSFSGKYIPFQISMSLFRDDFPWLYEAGMDVVKDLKSIKSVEEKAQVVSDFIELVEFSVEHPMMREMFGPDKEQFIMLRELPYMLKHVLKSE